MIGRLEVLPGPGTAARYGELAVWAGAGASPDLLSFLIQSARNLASLPDGGRRIADHLAGVLRQRDPEPAIPFVTVGPGEYTPITLLHGPVQMWDGARWVRPDPGIGWLVAEVSNLTTVLVTPNDTPAPPSANPILDLRLGVVPGGGLAVVLTPASMMPAEDEAAAETAGALPAAAAAGVVGEAPAETPEPGAPGTAAPGTPAPEVAVAGAVGLAGAALAGEAEAHERDNDVESTIPQAEEELNAPEESHPEVDVEGFPVTEMAPSESEPPAAEAPSDTAAEEAGEEPTEAPVEPIETTDLRAVSADSWTPLPLADAGTPNPPGGTTVRGLYCPRGHFNHGGAVTCAQCGLPLDPVRGEGEGPRPVLGVLVGTDRSLWRIDTSYVVGTNPGGDPVVTAGQARPLVVAEDGQTQAVHAELRAGDWSLSVLDRNSRSGTFVLPPGHSDWQKVPPDQAVTVKPGTHVAVGSTVFTFTSPWPL